MPVYEYQCKACQKEFEYQQRMSDPEKTTCEACGADKLERLISRTAFSLKGGGWYKDLYASSKPETKAADAPAKTESAPSSDSSSPAAPAASPSPAGGSATVAPTTAPSTSGGSSSGSGGSTSKSAASGAK